MKIIGATAADFISYAKQLDPAIQWKSTGAPAGTGEEGFLSYPAKVYSKHKLVKAGATIHKPCGHLVVAIVSGFIKANSNLEYNVTIWATKVKFTKYSQMSQYKHLAAKINEGYQCGCAMQGYPTQPGTIPKPDVKPTSPPTSFQHLIDSMAAKQGTVVAKPITPSEKPEAKHPWPITWEPVEGTMDEGETDAVPSARRGIFESAASLYVLEEIEVGIMVWERKHRGPRRRTLDDAKRDLFVKRFRAYRTQYAKRLARNLFDFCVMASYGEARYRDGQSFTLGHGKAGSRSQAYLKAMSFDPRHLIPVLERVFCYVNWGGTDNTGIGGPRWGNIAMTGAYYFKYAEQPVTFVDYCVDLVHNGGMAFNKHYLIDNPDNEHRFMQMLDRKREGSLLQWKGKPLPVVEPVLQYLIEATSWGYVAPTQADLKLVADVQVPTLKWGTKKPTGLAYLQPPLAKPIYWKASKLAKEQGLVPEQPAPHVKVPKAPAAATVHYPEPRKD